MLSTIAVNRTDDELSEVRGAPNPIQLGEALVTGFKGAFFAASVLLLAGLVLLLTMLKQRDGADPDRRAAASRPSCARSIGGSRFLEAQR